MPLGFNKTRIAPTPSGFLHLGNALSFIITDDLARRTGASILLRIDDMDRERMERAYVEDIFDTLRFLGIGWQEGPHRYDGFEKEWSQLRRLPLYGEALQQLRDDGRLFACTCSRTQVLRESADGVYPGTCRHKALPLDTPGASWRVRTAGSPALRVKDADGHVVTAPLPAIMRDMIVRKKDGFPAYQLTSLVDDVHFGIDLIVRGHDLWTSTLAQLHLAALLGKQAFLDAAFVHHRLVEARPGQKLSKSAGDTSIQFLRKQGRSREEVLHLIHELSGL